MTCSKTARCEHHPVTEMQIIFYLNLTCMHKPFCYCLVQHLASDVEKKLSSYPLPAQIAVHGSRHQWSTFLLQVSTLWPAAGSCCHLLSCNPTQRTAKSPRVLLQGRAQLSRSNRAIIQEEMRKDPSDMKDFLAGVCLLTSSAQDTLTQINTVRAFLKTLLAPSFLN